MTVTSTVNRVTYDGDGGTTAFPVPFAFFGGDELEVIERLTATGVETAKVLTSDYSVTGGAGAIGTVIAVAAPPTGVSWTIVRNTKQTQEIDYTDNDPFPVETHEDGLDRVTMIAQDSVADVGRAIKFPKTDSATLDSTLPNSLLRANKHLAFDGLGNPTPGVDILSLSASQFLNTFTGNGAQTAFTLTSAPASTEATAVYLEGIRQEPVTDYSVSGTTLTFVAAPPNLEVVIAAWNETFAGVPADGSVTLAKLADQTRGDLISFGVLGVPQILALGTVGQYVRSDGTDPAYSALLSGDLPAATEGAQGALEIATAAEMEAGAANDKIVTPLRQNDHPSAAKVWVNFDGTGTIAIRADHGVTSLTDNAVGNYDVNFDTNFSTANYHASAAAGTGVKANAGISATAVGAVTVLTSDASLGSLLDQTIVMVACHGDQ